MSFYDLSKDDRAKLVEEINKNILSELKSSKLKKTFEYFSDEDTYIRKSAYLAVGRIYKSSPELHKKIIMRLGMLAGDENEKVRQTAVNAAGEIGMEDFAAVECFFDTALFDKHHSVRNAVIGSVKKMGEKNPKPVLKWAKKYLHHSDKEIRREICHGIELRGRKYPQDILPLLKELQHDKTARVRDTLVHVIGQISYKKDCLVTVIKELKTWENKELVTDAIEEIIDVHDRYSDFAVLTQDEARKYIEENW
jgi:HEAT repeat protein